MAVAPTPGGGTWNRDGMIVYSPDAGMVSSAKGLWRVPANGGLPASVTTPADETHRAPVFLPDGRHLLYQNADKVFAISLDNPAQPIEVLSSARSVAFVAPDSLLYVRKNSLFVQRFDPRS